MDHDDDLERAIALSLMEAQTSTSSAKRGKNVAPGDTTLEDQLEERSHNDIQRAIPSKVGSQGKHAVGPTPKTENHQNGASTSIFLSERAQLEKERLTRLKRHRDDLETSGDLFKGSQRPHVKRPHLSSVEPTDRGVNQLQSAPSIPSNSESSSSTHAKPGSKTTGVQAVPVADQLFWDGELRPTANRHSQPREDGKKTFRLSEVLGPKADISFAIISSYSTSVSWIYEFFNPRTPVILVSQPDPSGRAVIKNVLPNWIMTVPFLRNGYGCQHMKFMLIFYKTGRLRVVISTANLIDYDWRDIENAVWLQDIPPRSEPKPHERKVDDFPSIMQRILHAVNVRPALANMLANDHPKLPLLSIEDLRSKWDFSKVHVKLIASVAGKHEGWPAVIQTGHPRLMKAVRDLGLRTGKGKSARELVLECQGSSIGTYSTQWLNEFHWSARGESAEDWLDVPKGRRSKLPWPSIRIVFPSLRTVRASVLGERGGGTMFCRTNQWEAIKSPKDLFFDSNSAGGRVLMHTKMIIATFRRTSLFASSSKPNSKNESTRPTSLDKGKSKVIVISDSETESESDAQENVSGSQMEPIGWAYVGSHNFTPSAWGTLSGSAFNPTLNVVNYELGIVIPLYEESDVKQVSCFKRPPRKYVLGEDRPWIQGESPVFRS